jgi:hypothetical protein
VKEAIMAKEPQSTSKETQILATGTALPKIDYVDLPELVETFSDSIHSIFFDGQSLRINFAVTRMGEFEPNQRQTGKRYPCCRLVLSPSVAVELMNRMQQIGSALTKAGILKAAPAQPNTEQTN